MNDNKKSGNLLNALAIGVVVGGVLGILFAPDKGKKTRKRILNKRDDAKEFMKVRLHNLLEDVQDRLESTTEKASKYLDIEKALNSKIMKLTLKIQDDCPELMKYIGEMTEGMPAEDNPEVTIRNLKTYCNSLETMYKKYMVDHKAGVSQN
jgi:gas vesicle protein